MCMLVFTNSGAGTELSVQYHYGESAAVLSFQHHCGGTVRRACLLVYVGHGPADITVPPPPSSEPAAREAWGRGEAIHIAMVDPHLMLYLEQEVLERKEPLGYTAVRVISFDQPL